MHIPKKSERAKGISRLDKLEFNGDGLKTNVAAKAMKYTPQDVLTKVANAAKSKVKRIHFQCSDFR